MSTQLANNIFLYYSGGSGGFLVLHGIILSKSHNANQYEVDYNSVINSQWDSLTHDYSKWKDTEIWPDNKKTEILVCDKIYFSCNPNKEDSDYKYFSDTNSIKVLVYAETALHLRLMRLKNANLYANGNKADAEQLNKINLQVNEYKSLADYSFNLRDIIKTKFKIVTDALRIPYNNSHIKLIDKWVKLHPDEIQDLLLKGE